MLNPDQSHVNTMTLFKINTHHAYLNTYIVIKWIGEISDTCKIICEPILVNKESHSEKLFNVSFNTIDRIKSIRLPAGKYKIHALSNGYKQEETLIIEDAIKLGGGHLKKSFVFDNNPWAFLTTRDRLYITNLDSKDEYEEFGVVPEEITALNIDNEDPCNYFLFRKKDDYSIFDVLTGKHVITFTNHIFSNSHLVIFKDDTDIVIYDFKLKTRIVQFNGQFSFGRKKFYYIKGGELFGLNLQSNYIKLIHQVGKSLDERTLLADNYLIRLISDSTLEKLYHFYDLGNGEDLIYDVKIHLPYYIHRFLEVKSSIHQNCIDNFNKYSEETKDIINKYHNNDEVICFCPGIYIEHIKTTINNNLRTFDFYGRIQPYPAKAFPKIPFAIKGNSLKPAHFKDAILCCFENPSNNKAASNSININNSNIITENETLLGKSSSGNLSVVKIDDHLYLRNNTDNSKRIIFTSVDFKLYNNAFLSSDGKCAMIKAVDGTWEKLGFDDLKLTKFDIENSTIGLKDLNSGVNGYKPIIDILNSDSRKPVWVDPITLQRVDSEKLSSYVFASPDNKYSASINLVRKYYNRLTNSEITVSEYRHMKELYDWSAGERNSEDLTTIEHIKLIINNRITLCNTYGEERVFAKYKKFLSNERDLSEQVFIEHNDLFTELFIEKHDFILLNNNYDKSEKLIFVDHNVWYLNYVSFSYDSNYLAFAAKLYRDNFYRYSEEGVFGLYDLQKDCFIKKIDKDFESNEDLQAVWISMFSKTNDIGFYDSHPCTYICSKKQDFNIIKIPGKNLLCFSPSGKFLALSNQQYIDYRHHPSDRSGHQPSGNVYIYDISDRPTQIAHFNDLGEGCKDCIKGVQWSAGNVASVSFSQDEKRLMIVGDDGVVVIRNLHTESISH